MQDLIRRLSRNQSKIWNFVGGVSAIIGLVCFALSPTFNKLIGGWDFLRVLIYVAVSLVILDIALLAKRIRISERFQSHAIALSFVLTCLITALHETFVNGKPDKLITASYASFALTSLSMSRKFALGFQTGLFTFFLGMCIAELVKMSWNFFPMVVVCYVLILFRYYSDSQSQSGRNGYLSNHVDPANRAASGDINRQQTQHYLRIGKIPEDNQQYNEEETHSSLNFQAVADQTHHSARIRQVSGESVAVDHQQNGGEVRTSSSLTFQATHHSPRIVEVSGESIARDPQQNGGGDRTSSSLSFQATHHSPRIGEVSGESIARDQQENKEEDGTSTSLSFQAEDNVSSRINILAPENGLKLRSSKDNLRSLFITGGTVRRRRDGIQNESSSYAPTKSARYSMLHSYIGQIAREAVSRSVRDVVSLHDYSPSKQENIVSPVRPMELGFSMWPYSLYKLREELGESYSSSHSASLDEIAGSNSSFQAEPSSQDIVSLVNKKIALIENGLMQSYPKPKLLSQFLTGENLRRRIRRTDKKKRITSRSINKKTSKRDNVTLGNNTAAIKYGWMPSSRGIRIELYNPSTRSVESRREQQMKHEEIEEVLDELALASVETRPRVRRFNEIQTRPIASRRVSTKAGKRIQK